MKRLLAIFLSMALLAFGIFHFLHDADTALPGTTAAVRPSTANVPVTPLAKTAPAAIEPNVSSSADARDGRTPAWLLPTSSPATSKPAAASATTSSASEKIVRLKAVLEKLNRLQTQTNIDAGAAAAAIAELEQINGSAVMNGVRLDVLRENVEIADRIQTTAAEMQRLQQSAPAHSPEQTALLQSKATELVALQSRIRHDILQSPDASGTRP